MCICRLFLSEYCSETQGLPSSSCSTTILMAERSTKRNPESSSSGLGPKDLDSGLTKRGGNLDRRAASDRCQRGGKVVPKGQHLLLMKSADASSLAICSCPASTISLTRPNNHLCQTRDSPVWSIRHHLPSFARNLCRNCSTCFTSSEDWGCVFSCRSTSVAVPMYDR